MHPAHGPSKKGDQRVASHFEDWNTYLREETVKSPMHASNELP
jgi:hypothetical protein